MNDLPLITIGVSAYNRKDYLKLSLDSLLAQTYPNCEIIVVDDGSSDSTWSIIDDLCQKTACIEGIKLSRNRGHQNALLAGLMMVKNGFDAVISMDADLQDDIDAIDKMVFFKTVFDDVFF